jgi:hypothetical protein
VERKAAAKAEELPAPDPETGEVVPVENPDVTLGKELLATAKKDSLVLEEITAAQDRVKLIVADSARNALETALLIRSFLTEQTHDAMELARDQLPNLPKHWKPDFKKLIDKREAEIKKGTA